MVVNVISGGVQWGDGRRGILEAALRGSYFDSYEKLLLTHSGSGEDFLLHPWLEYSGSRQPPQRLISPLFLRIYP